MKHSLFFLYLSTIAALFCFFFLAGCSVLKIHPPLKDEFAMQRIPSCRYPEFSDDMVCDGLEYGILQSISYLKRFPCSRQFKFGKDSFNAAHMIKSMEHFLNFIQTRPSKDDLNKFIKSNYLVYKSIGGRNGHVLFTGYYEPVLQGSLEQSTEYRFPIYARPCDLTTVDLSLFIPQLNNKRIIGRYAGRTVVPYFERDEIEYSAALKGKAEKIAWIKNQVDLFFLQIQGSGKIYFDNGKTINVHYDITNGRPYRSIGKLLIEEGKIEKSEMSMQKIRAYLSEHPEEVKTILNFNPSYVFFKIEEEGPLGCIEVKLTPGRSIALDRRIFPLSALAFIEAEKPLINGDGKIHNWITFSRFVLNHDTGGAIRGPGRADLFWGNGPYAKIAAGHMQHKGELYFLVLDFDKKR
ncbi:MAG: murein transglycosylase [Deltaproteobacteria bacterium]|nr:MAG: murein transglycosylase [Deltaproteobacteria bacterium]